MIRRTARDWLTPAGLLALLVAMALVAGSRSAGAQACVGDCGANGAVDVSELIRGVNIALGAAPMEHCPVFDANEDKKVGIEELVRAVGYALAGCPLTPTPPPATITPTVEPLTPTVEPPTPTAPPSPTATVPIPDVSGSWREDPLSIVSSTCLDPLTQEFGAELVKRPACVHEVSAAGSSAAVVDCNQAAAQGQVDHLGGIRFSTGEQSGTVGECTVSLNTAVYVAAGLSPTMATYTFGVSFGGGCPLASCTIVASARWTLVQQ